MMATESKAMALIVAELRRRRWHPVRIEDKSSTGTPDLNFHWRGEHVHDGIGGDIWVELKDATKEKSGAYSVEFRPAQRAWLIDAQKAGRNVWLLIRIGPLFWLALNSDKDWKRCRKTFYPESFGNRYVKMISISDLIDHISS